MRALGVDLGSKRIGLAISDSAGSIATAYEVLHRSGDPHADRRSIVAVAEEIGAECIVIGLPLNMDGSCGPAALGAIEEAKALGDTTDIPVETYDERLTTVTADRSLREQGVRGQDRRAVIDKLAAAVLLQAWLDHLAHQRASTS